MNRQYPSIIQRLTRPILYALGALMVGLVLIGGWYRPSRRSP